MNVRFSATAAIVLCLTVRGEPSAPARENTSLDEARRNLSELPATERSKDSLGKSSGLGSAGLPALTLPGDNKSPENKPTSDLSASPTWLQDAFNQTAGERNQRRSAADSALTREKANGYKPLQAPDPFGQYLEQWLSPRDLELLRPDSKKSADFPANNSPDQKQRPAGNPGELVTQPELGAASILSVTRNPYLDDSGLPSNAPLPNPFVPPESSGAQRNERNRVLPTLPMPASANTPRSVGPSKPAVAPAEASPKPPTAPIVDDRKYFPQLRRF